MQLLSKLNFTWLVFSNELLNNSCTADVHCEVKSAQQTNKQTKKYCHSGLEKLKNLQQHTFLHNELRLHQPNRNVGFKFSEEALS